MLIRLLFILSITFIASCAYVPAAIDSEGFANEVTPGMVANIPENYLGQRVRWGGVIVEVVNNEDETWIEILGLPLSSSARPLADRTEALGRFIVKTKEFLDPEVYQNGLRFTVIGTIGQPIEGKVGERDYIYPTIDVESHYLWPRRTQHRHYVTPGYWFYGFHPYWRFGYPYFGYGVWSYQNYYYPYFPVYGYLSRSRIRPHNHYRSGNFAYSRNLDWSQRQRAIMLRDIQIHRFPGYSNANYRRITKDPVMRTSGDRSSGVRNTREVNQPSTRISRESATRNNRSSVSRSSPRTRPSRSVSVPRRTTKSPNDRIRDKQ